MLRRFGNCSKNQTWNEPNNKNVYLNFAEKKMTSNINNPYYQNPDVRWDDPRIQDLMRRAESLSIDQRGSNSPQAVLISPNWSLASAALPGVLMDDDGVGQLTIVTSVAFAINDPIVVEKPRVHPYSPELILCTVSNCRPGQRAEDQGKIFVSHLAYKPRESGQRR